MATENILVSALIPASPQTVYDAWLSSEQHARMTGGGAQIEPHVGGAHRAWDDYITGTTLELDPGRRIVQSWRTLQFPPDAGDSQIAVTFEEEAGQTRVKITHTDIPEGQGASYQSGWDEHYFSPMVAYFSSSAPADAILDDLGKLPGELKAAKKGAAKKAAKKGAAKKTAKKGAKKGAAKKTAKKTAKKGAKKTAKKAARKTAKKGAARKGAAKKAARKGAAKKTARKGAAKKTARKGAAS
jgi:uncharacterized protein YndB with AHSA1/START domain